MLFKFPVFVLAKDCGEISIYTTLESLEKKLEPIDVENEEYEVWDAQGVRLKLYSQRPTWLKIEGTQPDFEGLKITVLRYAETSGMKIEKDSLESFSNLEQIIKTVNKNKIRPNFFKKFWEK